MRRGYVWLALVAVLVLPVAQGHAVLLSSEPAGGSQLDHPPGLVRVTLTEAIDPGGATLHVYNQDGVRVDLDDLIVQEGPNPILTTGLPEDLADGAYSIRWAALSTVDGHTTFGTVGFAVGGFEPPTSSSGDIDRLDLTNVTARTLAFAGFALVLAAATCMMLLRHENARAPARNLRTIGAMVHLAGVTILALDSARDAGLSFAAFATTGVGGVLVPRLFIAVGASALALIWWRRDVAMATPIIAISVAVAGIFSARLGHASQTGTTAIALDVLHLWSSAFWVGALVALSWLVWKPGTSGLDNDKLRTIVARFGTMATLAVVLIIGTGSILSVAILDELLLRPGIWIASTWGLVLVAKLVGLAVMLTLAARNRFWFLKRGLHSTPQFLRSVTIETAVGLIVLVLAGALTSVGAPTEIPEVGETYSLLGDDVYGSLTVTPVAKVGSFSTLSFFLQTDDGPIRGNTCGRDGCLFVDIGSANGTERRILEHRGDGVWEVPDWLWTSAGETNITLNVQTDVIYRDVVEGMIPVRG